MRNEAAGVSCWIPIITKWQTQGVLEITMSEKEICGRKKMPVKLMSTANKDLNGSCSTKNVMMRDVEKSPLQN